MSLNLQTFQQQIANGALLLGATLLGGTAYAISEKQQRSSFQETKRSLRDKLTIEQQSKEQVTVFTINTLTFFCEKFCKVSLHISLSCLFLKKIFLFGFMITNVVDCRSVRKCYIKKHNKIFQSKSYH